MRIHSVILSVFIFTISCAQKEPNASYTPKDNPRYLVNRTIEHNLISSDSLPAIQIQVNKNFEYVGRFDFEIIANSDEYDADIQGKAVAAGERVVFVDSDNSRTVNRLFIVQFEGFLPNNDFQFNYNFDNAEFIGANKYRHNTWFYNSKQLAVENPQNEGAKTRSFLLERGFKLEDEFMMSRFVGLASDDRKHEIIIFYLEMLRKNLGITLEDFENSTPNEEVLEIRKALVERSKHSFKLIEG